MFDSILETLTKHGKGSHAYRAAARLAYEKARDCPDQAAAFFLIATYAEAFVERNERMPLLSNDSENSYNQLKSNLDTLNAAYAAGDPAKILAALNTISVSYAETMAD
ncbi:hypothetical protein P5P81_05545 [Tritonibacter mobilis]|nr:hypothetical protein [Tritonibacter mobilis]